MSETEPLVSIIVLTYNSSKFILETLESAKAQTHQNIELIITDDFSTDETIQLCNNWVNLNKSRFVNTKIVCSETNTGIAANCNRGCSFAKGEWLKLIAGDDILIEDCISSYLDYIHHHRPTEIDILVAKSVSFYDSIPENIIRYPIDEDERLFYQMKKYSPYDNFNISTPTLFYSRKLWQEIKFDERFPMVEDGPFLWKVFQAGKKIYRVPEVTVGYRVHQQSVSRKLDSYPFNIIYAKSKLDSYVILRRKHIPLFYRLEADFVYVQYRLIIFNKGKHAAFIYKIFSYFSLILPSTLINKFRNRFYQNKYAK